MRRSPVINSVRPRVGTRLNRSEFISAIHVRNGAPAASEIRIQRGQIRVDRVPVSPSGVRLPDFDKYAGNALSVLVHNPAMNDDPFADGALPWACKVCDKVVVLRAKNFPAERRSGQFARRVPDRNQGPSRRAGNAAFVLRGKGRRLPLQLSLKERHYLLAIVGIIHHFERSWIPTQRTPSSRFGMLGWPQELQRKWQRAAVSQRHLVYLLPSAKLREGAFPLPRHVRELPTMQS